MATHPSILAWRIPWTEEPGGLQSLGHKEWDMTKHSVAAVSKVGGQDNLLGIERRRWYSFCIFISYLKNFYFVFQNVQGTLIRAH